MIRAIFFAIGISTGIGYAEDSTSILYTLRDNFVHIQTLDLRSRQTSLATPREASHELDASNEKSHRPKFMIEYLTKGLGITSTVHFRGQGDKFRSDYQESFGSADYYREGTFAYNSQVYQEFVASDESLQVSKYIHEKQSHVGPTPFLSAFGFLPCYRGASSTFQMLKDKETWDQLAASTSIMSNNTNIDGHACVVLESLLKGNTSDGTDERAILYLSKNDGYYPLRSEVYAQDGQTLKRRTDINGIQKLDIPGGSTVFLHKSSVCTTYWGDGSGRVSETATVDVFLDEARINEAIPAEVFTIPITQARMYIDKDDKSKSMVVRPDMAETNAEALRGIESASLTEIDSNAQTRTVAASPANTDKEELVAKSNAIASPGTRLFLYIAILFALGTLVLLLSWYVTRKRHHR